MQSGRKSALPDPARWTTKRRCKQLTKLLDKIDKKVTDIDARVRLHSIVQVLINSLNEQLSPNQPPTVAPTAMPTAGTEPLLVNFTANASDPDGSIASTLWIFGDGATSTDVNPAHTYTCDGDYTAKVLVTDDQGAVASGEVTVSVASAGGPIHLRLRRAADFQCKLHRLSRRFRWIESAEL